MLNEKMASFLGHMCVCVQGTGKDFSLSNTIFYFLFLQRTIYSHC